MDPICFGVLCWSLCFQSICSLHECVTVSTLSFCRFIREEQQAMLGNQYLRPETWKNWLCLYCLEMCVCLLTLWCHFPNYPITFCCDQTDSNIMLIKHLLSFIALDVQEGDGSPPTPPYFRCKDCCPPVSVWQDRRIFGLFVPHMFNSGSSA